MGAKNVEIIVLGCGGSGGVPFATGHWGRCNPETLQNRRTRASIAIRTERTCVIVDSGSDFREQVNRENIQKIDAVIYTHDHADHVNGIDDVRYAAIKRRINGEDNYIMPIHGDEDTLNSIKERFPYMFRTSKDGLYFPLVAPQTVEKNEVLSIGDLNIQSFIQVHGNGQSLGYRIGDIAYSTDVSAFDEDQLEFLKGIKTWIVDCGQYGADTADLTVHPNLETVLKWNENIGAEKLYLTHLTPRSDYNVVNSETADYIECAYDGLKLKTEI